MKKINIVVILLLLGIGGCTSKQKFYISSGSPGAIYYPTAKALCKNFNKHDNQYKCIALKSSGADNNLKGLKEQKFEFSISQATLQNDYYKNKFAKNTRSVMGLHHEHFSIVVSENSNIKTLDDLVGKRVNIGNPGSGSRIYFEKIMQKKSWLQPDFAKIYEEKSSNLDDLICTGKIDAAIYLVGHPNKIFSKIINDCNGKLLNLNLSDRSFLKDVFPEFKNTIINSDLYKKQPNTVETIGIPVILSTHNKVNVEIVNQLKKFSIENKELLEKQHIIFKEINFELPHTARAPTL